MLTPKPKGAERREVIIGMLIVVTVTALICWWSYHYDDPSLFNAIRITFLPWEMKPWEMKPTKIEPVVLPTRATAMARGMDKDQAKQMCTQFALVFKITAESRDKGVARDLMIASAGAAAEQQVIKAGHPENVPTARALSDALINKVYDHPEVSAEAESEAELRDCMRN